jgi:hypothetical protein
MTLLNRLLLGLLSIVTAGCFPLSTFVRQVDQSFPVKEGSRVSVDIGGGAVHCITTPGGVVTIHLREQVSADSEEQAADVLRDYTVAIAGEDGAVSVLARRKPGLPGHLPWNGHVSFATTIEAPADVQLDLHTSGGSIRIEGDRLADVRAETSGGSVTAAGSQGSMLLRTSGGSIAVDRTLGALEADTSGGSIRVGYIGPSVTDVSLRTSGGSIRAAIDPAARLDLAAETSGGSVHVSDLPFAATSQGHSRVAGLLNGGGAGQLHAHTSGGSIDLRPAFASSEPTPARP